MKQLTIKKKITLWYTGIIAVVLGTILVLVLLFVDKVGISATEEEIIEAAKCANIHDFIMELPDQYDTFVGERGARLSGGQKQRMTIARAVVREPEILILDDSASALDFATDAKLRHAIREMGNDMTVIIVSQRSSSIQYADQIIVLDDGKMVGIGTHESLLADNEVYQEIYYSQFPKEAAGNEK